MSEADIDIADAHTAVTSVKGRRVVVTGGTTGIGRAIAVLLASEGADLFICGRDATHLGDALDRIGEVGSGQGIAVDLAEPGGVARFFDAAEAALGGIDVAVINAAIPADDLASMSQSEIDYALAADFTSTIASARAAINAMEGGDLILIGSKSAVTRGKGSSVYAAAKSGIQGLAEALGKELGERSIKVSLIEPGLTGADFHLPDMPPEEQRDKINANAMLRAEDVAVATLFILNQPPRTRISLLRIEPSSPEE